MNKKLNGASIYISQKHLLAIYVHCSDHSQSSGVLNADRNFMGAAYEICKILKSPKLLILECERQSEERTAVCYDSESHTSKPHCD
jgi:hypothetical protein